MARYITKRVLRSLITMFIIITILFALLRLMPVEGYFENYDKMSSTQIQVKLQALWRDRSPAHPAGALLQAGAPRGLGRIQRLPQGRRHYRDHCRERSPSLWSWD